jgi:hypothetical protein
MRINLDDFDFEYGTAVSKPTAKEGSRSFTLDNQSGYFIRRWGIDEVIFKNSIEERCDYLIEVQKPNNRVYYWIELKGKDLVKACRQILNTIRLANVLEEADQEARVITSGTNKIDIRTLDYINLDRLMRSKRGRLRTYTNEGIEKI